MAFCPGDEVTYTCDVGTAIGNTKWSFSEGNCDDEFLILSQKADKCSSSKSSCGAFGVTNSDPGAGQPCTVSMFTVDVSKVANGTVIRCLNIGLSGKTEIGSATISKEGQR